MLGLFAHVSHTNEEFWVSQFSSEVQQLKFDLAAISECGTGTEQG